MKKITFDDKYGLYRAVLNGKKTMTRRVCKYDRPSLDWGIAFPIIENESKYESYEDMALNAPNFGSFCWQKLDKSEHTKLNRLTYREGEVVAIAQRYEDIVCNSSFEDWEIKNLQNSKGWNNKTFVRADLMPHQIKITNIFLQRLQDISDEDCLKEGVIKSSYENSEGKMAHYYWHLGVTNKNCPYGQYIEYNNPREAFASLIDEVSGKGIWERNPFVFVYEFELIK